MLNLFSRLAAVLLLRLGPQDVPAGSQAMLTSIGAYVLVTSINLNLGNPHPRWMLVVGLAVALPMVMTRILLGLRGRLARWEQTISAKFGTSALLALLTLPINLAGSDNLGPGAALITLVAFFWSFSVSAHIWRHALDIGFAAGLALSVALFAVTVFIITTLAGSI